MIIGLVVMIAGYVLMVGGGSNDPDVFNESMFDTRKLVIAPIVILLGIAVVIFGIMKRPGKGKAADIQKKEDK